MYINTHIVYRCFPHCRGLDLTCTFFWILRTTTWSTTITRYRKSLMVPRNGSRRWCVQSKRIVEIVWTRRKSRRWMELPKNRRHKHVWTSQARVKVRLLIVLLQSPHRQQTPSLTPYSFPPSPSSSVSGYSIILRILKFFSDGCEILHFEQHYPKSLSPFFSHPLKEGNAETHQK